MTRDELIAADVQPGDKVWLKPVPAVVALTGPCIVTVALAGRWNVDFPAEEIDRIEKAPRPLKVGDRVRGKLSRRSGHIIGIDRAHAAVVWDGNERGWPELTDLVRIDPEPGQ